MQCPNIAKKISNSRRNFTLEKRKNIIDKRNSTIISKYGSLQNYNNKVNKSCSNTIRRKYGADNISQVEKIKNKIKHTKHSKTIEEKLHIVDKFKHTCIAKHGSIEQYYKEITAKRQTTKLQSLNSLANTNNCCAKILEHNRYNTIVQCSKCNHTYSVSTYFLLYRLRNGEVICPHCNVLMHEKSKEENELYTYINSIYDGQIINCDRTTIFPKELDLYLPEKKLAFEFNGLYWHSELFKTNEYHKDKTNNCLSHDIQLIHVFEDDWHYRQEIVKSRISSLIGRIEYKNLC